MRRGPSNAQGNVEIDWKAVRRVLVIKLRSIGDTVLATPSLIALKRFVPNARIDILLEDWVAPVLDGSDAVDNVLTVGKSSADRVSMAWQLRRQRYDVVFNLHGGTTATFLTAATRARHRVGLTNYQYSFLYNHLLSSPIDYWQRKEIHSAEQQLALLGFAGVPVDDLPKSRLTVTAEASRSLAEKFLKHGSGPLSEFGDFVLIHPTAAFATKQWDTAKFAQTAEFLYEKKLKTIAVAANFEASVLSELVSKANIPIAAFHDLTLPEITSLASQARLFVGNDSGIAHIAAAVNTPSVVIFGSSNRVHWRPWTEAPNEIVYEAFPCQPCPGYVCAEYGEPRCILTVPAESVFGAIDRVLSPKK